MIINHQSSTSTSTSTSSSLDILVNEVTQEQRNTFRYRFLWHLKKSERMKVGCCFVVVIELVVLLFQIFVFVPEIVKTSHALVFVHAHAHARRS